jgi:hypothetical protein
MGVMMDTCINEMKRHFNAVRTEYGYFQVVGKVKYEAVTLWRYPGCLPFASWHKSRELAKAASLNPNKLKEKEFLGTWRVNHA